MSSIKPLVALPEVGSRLAYLVGAAKAPGISVAVATAEAGPVVFAAGHARLGPAAPVTERTSFPWFSATKLLTATAILQLVENGRVELDRPVGDYLSERPLVRRGRPATVRQLLAHAAGLANPFPLSWVHLASEVGPSLDGLTNRLFARHGSLVRTPGTRTAYSNLGYLLLGQIVERSSGIPFSAYIERNVLGPLGCRATGFTLPEGCATGYQRRRSFVGLLARLLLDRRLFTRAVGAYRELAPFLVDGAPYGGLVGPVSDLIRLGKAVLRGGVGEDGRVLSAASVHAMLSSAALADGPARSMGLGWHLSREGREPFAYHQGGGGGFRSELRVYSRLGMAIAAAANETSARIGKILDLLVASPAASVAVTT